MGNWIFFIIIVYSFYQGFNKLFEEKKWFKDYAFLMAILFAVIATGIIALIFLWIVLNDTTL